MALANDNYYGYALKMLIEKRITWLECAASSLVWTTILVYYLEKPYGHLMLEEMEGPQARTTARGNLFSFELPWEDVFHRCKDAEKAWMTAASAARRSCALPHDEDVLATLVNVHIVGGSAEAVAELEGATMRIAVVIELITELRGSGYPGYRQNSTLTQQFELAQKLCMADMETSHLFQIKYAKQQTSHFVQS